MGRRQRQEFGFGGGHAKRGLNLPSFPSAALSKPAREETAQLCDRHGSQMSPQTPSWALGIPPNPPQAFLRSPEPFRAATSLSCQPSGGPWDKNRKAGSQETWISLRASRGGGEAEKEAENEARPWEEKHTAEPGTTLRPDYKVGRLCVMIVLWVFSLEVIPV